MIEREQNPGNAPGYPWYSRIEVACRNLQATLVAWQNCDDESDYQQRNLLEKDNLPGDIKCLNRMHQKLCWISGLIHVVNRIHLVF